jgi:predicted nucleotidyltransferase component of viral defense system
MKDIAIALAKQTADGNDKLNLLREYLQACALRSLHESGAFRNLSFVGGTALRFLYDLPRFSEDLDFSLENTESYMPADWLGKLKRDFTLQGFPTEITWNDRKTVHVAWVKVAGLLSDAAIVSRPEQKLSIKLEIDTRPPEGAVLETRIVQKHFLFALRHHDLPSLMAGKIRALLTRPFQKGRDWYDLVWYLGKIPTVIPNESLLRNALAQSSETNHFRAEQGWKGSIILLLESLKTEALRDDVGVFLEHPEEVELLTRENLVRLLKT